MEHFYEIKTTTDKWYDDFLKIYSTSFPIHEQRDNEQQKEAFKNEHYHLICLIESEKLHSFICYWEFENYVYIEHFAVNNKLRGQNIGSGTLSLFKQEINKTIILEIDPVKDKVSAKRLRFYEKSGFKVNAYRHHHPPYNSNYPPHELAVLSTDIVLTQNQYDIFKHDLKYIVMK